MTVTDALLGPLLSDATRATRPLVTFYDDATGERVELSGLTFVNWVAKTANLLRDECDVVPGSTVAVLLPAHWQTTVALLGAWWCGAHVLTDPDGGAGADVALCDAGSIAAAGDAELVVAFSLDAMGRGLDDLPASAVDYATEVRVHGDHFTPLDPVPASAPALGGAAVGDVVAAAGQRAAQQGITGADRVLSLAQDPLEAVDVLLAVLAAEASLVHVRHPDAAAVERRVPAERVTRRL